MTPETDFLELLEGSLFAHVSPNTTMAIPLEQLYDFYEEHASLDQKEKVKAFKEDVLIPLERYIYRDFSSQDEDIETILNLNTKYKNLNKAQLYAELIKQTQKYQRWMISDLLDIFASRLD
jgi:hypothetical protein